MFLSLTGILTAIHWQTDLPACANGLLCSTPIPGALVGVCLLALFRWSMLLLRMFDDPIAKPRKQLQESLHWLQSIREDIQGLLQEDWLSDLIL